MCTRKSIIFPTGGSVLATVCERSKEEQRRTTTTLGVTGSLLLYTRRGWNQTKGGASSFLSPLCVTKMKQKAGKQLVYCSGRRLIGSLGSTHHNRASSSRSVVSLTFARSTRPRRPSFIECVYDDQDAAVKIKTRQQQIIARSARPRESMNNESSFY